MKKLLLLVVCVVGLVYSYACLAQEVDTENQKGAEQSSKLNKGAVGYGRKEPTKAASGVVCNLSINERLRADAWQGMKVFSVGDPIWFDAIVKNTSQHTVVLNSSYYDEKSESGPAFRVGVDPVLLDEAGREVAPIRQARFKTPDQGIVFTQAEEIACSFYLGDWYKLEKPGHYSFYLRFHGLPGIEEAETNRVEFQIIPGVAPEEKQNYASVALTVLAMNPADAVHLQVYLDGEIVLDEEFKITDINKIAENKREFLFNLAEGKHLIKACNLNSNAVFEKEFEITGSRRIFALLSYTDSSVGSSDTHDTLHPPDSFIFEIQVAPK